MTLSPDPPVLDSDSSLLTDLSSELSSVGSLSPVLGYPSPLSSQDPESGERFSIDSAKKHKLEDDDTPVTKKRKRPEPKPRTTQLLDLTSDPCALATEQKTQLDLLLKVLRKRRKIVVIAGAGISVSAGIPDFRSSTGLFKSLKSEHKLKASGKQLFDASVYQNDASTSSFHDMVRSLSGMVKDAKPTAFHQMLSTLGSEGRLLRLYTQNVDGIDVALPSLETAVPLGQKGPWPRSVQLHGGLEKMVCSKCRHLSDFEPTLFNGPEPPPCTACIEADRVRTDHAGKRSHGIGRLRPRIVLYNEHNPDEEAIGAVVGADLKTRPDAVIVVGTSMKIPGVKRIVREMCGVVRSRRDGIAVWLNQDGPPPGKEFEDCWDLIVKGPCDEVARQWNLSVNEHTACTTADIERAKEDSPVEVVVTTTPRKLKAQAAGMMTPAPSPRPKQKPIIKLNVRPEKSTVDAKEVSTKATATTKKRTPASQIPNPKKPAQAKKPRPSNIKIVKKREVGAGAIEMKWKLTKPHSAGARPPKSSKPPSSTLSKDISIAATPPPKNPTKYEWTSSGAMVSISPSSARNNGPLASSPDAFRSCAFANSASTREHAAHLSDAANTFSASYCSHGQTAESVAEQSISHSRTPSSTIKDERASLSPILQRGTISPTSVPRGMELILD